MRKALRAIAFVVVASGMSALAAATGTQWTGPLQVAHVETVGPAGGFIIYLSGFSDPNCSNDPTGIYVYPNAEGVTAAGVNQMLAQVLMLQATGGTVSILYDNTSNVSTGLCFAEYLKS